MSREPSLRETLSVGLSYAGAGTDPRPAGRPESELGHASAGTDPRPAGRPVHERGCAWLCQCRQGLWPTGEQRLRQKNSKQKKLTNQLSLALIMQHEHRLTGGLLHKTFHLFKQDRRLVTSACAGTNYSNGLAWVGAEAQQPQDELCCGTARAAGLWSTAGPFPWLRLFLQQPKHAHLRLC